MEDHCLVLPDIAAEDLLTFLRCLFAKDTADWDGRLMARLASIGRTIGVSAAEGITSFRPEPPPPVPPPAIDKYPKRSRIMAAGGGNSSSHRENSSEQLPVLFLEDIPRPNSSGTTTAIINSSSNGVTDKKCLLKLSEVNLETVTDEVLTENFCDQDGRLGKFFTCLFLFGDVVKLTDTGIQDVADIA
jgi:hypothetical protein